MVTKFDTFKFGSFTGGKDTSYIMYFPVALDLVNLFEDVYGAHDALLSWLRVRRYSSWRSKLM
jgi:hypothetical protein